MNGSCSTTTVTGYPSQLHQGRSGCSTKITHNIYQSPCTIYRLGLAHLVCSCMIAQMLAISYATSTGLLRNMRLRMPNYVVQTQMRKSPITAIVFSLQLVGERRHYRQIPISLQISSPAV